MEQQEQLHAEKTENFQPQVQVPSQDAMVSDDKLRELVERALAAEAAFLAMPGNPTRAYWVTRRASLDAIGALAGEMMPEVVLSLLDRATALRTAHEDNTRLRAAAELVLDAAYDIPRASKAFDTVLADLQTAVDAASTPLGTEGR
jgi:hypothetical protein